MDCWTAGSLAVNWGKPSAFLSLFIVCFSSDGVLPEGCAWCSMHGPWRVLCGVKLPLKRNSSRVCRLFPYLHFNRLHFECKELQLMLLVGLFQLGGGVSWCLAPSGMHTKRTEGVHSLPCVLFAGVGGDGQLHMAFPASVANVRGSRVGWDSAARE